MFNNTQAIRCQDALVLKRCSSAPQTANSMANQGRTTDQAVAEFKINVVKEELLEGVSGSIPGNRADIDKIIARKRTRNDFKVLLVQDTSRFTRAGQGHGQKLLYELRAVGILVYFVAEDLLVDNEMAEMYASFLFSAGRHTVKQLAYAATVGATNSYLTGKSPYTRRPPMGLDRMYSDNGVDRHIIRNMADGTQEQYDVATGKLIRTFAKNEKKGVPNHYIKQKNEQIRLIPGDPKIIAIVLLIFHLHYAGGLSYRAIARKLNDSDILSSQGKGWHSVIVRSILLNPIYIGLGIRCRAKRSIYYYGTEGQPHPSEVTLEELANSNSVKSTPRPRSEWMERVQPHLENFLPESYRHLAKYRIDQYLESIADAKPKVPNRDRHRNSDFILKGVLRSKQGKHLMTGRVGGKKGKEVRTYAVAKGHNIPRTNNVLAKRIRAKPLEDAVMGVVRQVVTSQPNLKAALKKLIEQNIRQVQDDSKNPDQLHKEIERKQKQIILLSDGVELEEDDVLTNKVKKIKAEIWALKRRQQTSPQQAKRKDLDPDTLAKAMAKELQSHATKLNQRNNPHVGSLLGLLISRMEADLETKEIEIELSVPTWVGTALNSRGPLGLDELTAYSPINETHSKNELSLGVFDCRYAQNPVCYTCKRRIAA